MRHRIGDAGFHWRHFGCLCISCQKNLYQFFRSHKNRCEVIGTVLFRWLLFCLGFESLWTPNYLLSLAIWERFCSLMCWRIITIILQQRAKYHVIIQTVDVELEMVASRPNGWRRQFLFNIRMFFFFFVVFIFAECVHRTWHLRWSHPPMCDTELWSWGRRVWAKQQLLHNFSMDLSPPNTSVHLTKCTTVHLIFPASAWH